MDYNILKHLTPEEADAVIAFCIPRSEQYRSCLSFDEWMEQKNGRNASFEEVYQQYTQECLLTTEEEAREYYIIST